MAEDENNDDPAFLKYWFSGVDGFLKTASESSKNEFLDHCAKACSDSYSLKLYQEAFSGNSTLPAALDALRQKFEDFDYRIAGNGISIFYKNCGCDLVQKGQLRSPYLCLCSKKSLEYNLKSVLPEKEIVVIQVASILGGDNRCEFEVHIDDKNNKREC
jgi:hypothetical protein